MTWLALQRGVAAATQNQAFNALVFLYRHVIKAPLGEIENISRLRRPPKLPVVLTHDETMAVMERLHHPHKLIASLIYGGGLRVTEAVRLRVKDVDFGLRTITVRNGKGEKDRNTLLPNPLARPLRALVETRTDAVKATPAEKRTPTSMPGALARKHPFASVSAQWQWLFPSEGLCQDQEG